ncbi:MAG TPA: hypothetical protein VMS00_06360 [Acidimicrobiales bacterium]|nr:hypothetical protein [Acidimicrobiales bacterium]
MRRRPGAGRQGLPTNHYLLPHERYWAARLLRKQAAHPDSKVVRQFQEQWAPEGIVLLAAAQVGVISAAPVVFVGAACLIAWGGRGAGLVVFYLFDVLAGCSVLLSVVRNRQRARAVRHRQTAKGKR